MKRHSPPPSSAALVTTLIHAVTLLALTASVAAHALLDWPNARGGLNNRLCTHRIDSSAPTDYSLHFPAGDRNRDPGAGFRSQKRVGHNNWTPFRPLSKSFRWRAGVCGDPVRGYDHLRGGKYTWPRRDPRVVARFRPGDVIDASMRIVAHHNGFVELHLCDVSRCPRGDISPACFRNGHCIQLRRARNPLCDSGWNRQCGPIDRRHPGRWYLPCSRVYNDFRWERYGPGTMKFQIPPNFSCRHCVLHWFYTSANSCNPRDVVDYFDGPDRPRGWGNCPGQGGARGGIARRQPPCGGRRFPEEYFNCADIVVQNSKHGRRKKHGRRW